MEEKNITQPQEAFQVALNAVIEDKEESVYVKNKKFKIHDLKNCVFRKITDLELTEKDSPKLRCKQAAAIVCNNYWSLKFLFGFVFSLRWMWYYYFEQYTDKDLLPLINLAKKKAEIATMASTLNTILLTGMMDTEMTMTMKERKHIQAESSGEQRGAQRKSSIISPKADTSSSD